MVSYGLLGTGTVIAVEVLVHGSRRCRVHPVLRIRDVYSESRTKFFHPGSEFFHPGSRIQGRKDSGSQIPHHRILVFLTQKSVSKLLEKLSEMFILDLDPDFFPTRIQGSKTGFLIRIGSVFNPVSGSGSGIRIRIQEGKNDPQK
jgi:hypothetical protein